MGSVLPEAGVGLGGNGRWRNGKLPWAKERQLGEVGQMPSKACRPLSDAGLKDEWGGEKREAGPRLSRWVVVLHKPPGRPHVKVIYISVTSRVR